LRQYFELNNNIISLPKELTSSPNNPLLGEIEAIFNFKDPITSKGTYSYDHYYYSLDFFKFLLLLNWLNYTYIPFINSTLLNEYFLFYLFGIQTPLLRQGQLELVKNTQRPMRKGITNMLRLHATGAVAMPIEIRIQILASSRDVIHS
jgi:hypothetical protein